MGRKSTASSPKLAPAAHTAVMLSDKETESLVASMALGAVCVVVPVEELVVFLRDRPYSLKPVQQGLHHFPPAPRRE